MASEAPKAVVATVEPAKPQGFLAKLAGVAEDAASLLESFGAPELAGKLGLRERADRARAIDAKGKAAKAAYEASSIPEVVADVKRTLAERKAEVAKKGKRRSILGRR